MECPSCESQRPMKSKRVIHRFRESGLDNLVLHGVKRFDCSQCGEVLFDYGNVNQLHALIADTLLRKKDLLTGAEIRFLRTYVGYSGEIFSRLIGLGDKTSLSRIENGRSKVSNQVNMTVRFAVAGKMADRDYDLHDLLEAIENEGLIPFKTVEFRSSSRGLWEFKSGIA
ncbi:MAG: type II TA system antitoxin MqsA family protein [Bdellovibrionales bacterium]